VSSDPDQEAKVARRSPSSLVGVALVSLVLVACGFLFATSASTARGTDLRGERTTRLVDLIRERQDEHDSRLAQVTDLRTEVDALGAQAAETDSTVAAAREEAEQLAFAAGVTEVVGPGLAVRLDDAPRDPGEPLPPGVSPDDLVVHQQDLQGVINAMWAGGGEAIQVMDQRLISTSAVRCVGNTLILGGRVYSPPYVVTAIGDREGMRRALDEAPAVQTYREWAEVVGLGYEVEDEDEVTVAAYEGALELQYAEAVDAPA
jgi:uncharacterized protein YlxW (UPF0749 family)